MGLGVRIYEDTKATALAKDGVGVLVTTPLGRVRAAKVALATNAFKPLLKRLSHYVVPVYDYCMVTEPLTAAQLASLGWANRQGVSDISNQFHYYRLTEDNRILWGGYDTIYFWRGKVSTELESRPETWATLSRHFFTTFPQLEGLRFTHAWGGAIDTCSRFCVFWGQAMQGRLAYALGYTGLGVGSSRFGAEVMLDLLDGRRSRATLDRLRPVQAAAVPARTVPLRRHPGHPLGDGPRGPHGQAQPVAAHPRPHGPRLRQLIDEPARERRRRRCPGLRDDDGATDEGALGHAAVGLHAVVQREPLGGHLDDAGTSEIDELDQLVATAPVDRGDRHRVRLVTEPDTGAGPDVADADDRHVGADAGDGHTEVHRRLDADDVEDERGTVAADHLADLGGGVRSGPHGGIRADRRGVLELAVVEIDGDDAHPGEHLQQLDRHVPEAAGADHHGPTARPDPVDRSLDGVVRREAGVGERDRHHRVEVADRHEVARAVDDEEVGHRAGRAEARRSDAQLGGSSAVVLPAAAALPAHAAAPRAVDEDLIADADAGGPVAERDDLARALVAQCQRQREREALRRDRHDVLVGVAHPCGGDAEQHLTGTRLGVGQLDELGTGSDGAVLQGAHRAIFPVARHADSIGGAVREHSGVSTMQTTAALPAPTDDVERAEHDLSVHGICAVTDVLTGDVLRQAHDGLYAAAAQDRARGREQKFGLDFEHDDTNQRVWNVLSRAPVFEDLVEHPVALRLLRSVLGWPMLLGNLSANITGPGGGEMVLHADQIFVPTPWPAEPQGANAAWCVDDFTADNGATCFVPGSHRLHRLPEPDDDVVAVPMEAPAGSLVVFESRIWHRTGFNRTADQRRAGIFGWYTRPIYRTQENWFLSLDPRIRQFASDDLLTLLGYRAEGLGLVYGASPA